MVGLKRKIPIEKIKDKNSRSVAFTKRRYGLYSKAAKLCQQFDAQIAVLIASPSSQRSNFFYSFGHYTVDTVVEAFLENRSLVPKKKSVCNSSLISLHRVNEALEAEREKIAADKRRRDGLRFKRKELGFECEDDAGKKENRGYLQGKKQKQALGFWWEDDEFEMYEDANDLRIIIEGLERLKINIKSRLNNNLTGNKSFSDDDDTKSLSWSFSCVAGDCSQLGCETNKDPFSDEHSFPDAFGGILEDFNFDFDLDCFKEPQPELDSSVHHLDLHFVDGSEGDDRLRSANEDDLISLKGFKDGLLGSDETDIREGQTSSGYYYPNLFQEFASCLC